MVLRRILLLCAMAIILAACVPPAPCPSPAPSLDVEQGPTPAGDPTTPSAPAAPRDTEPDASDREVADLVAGNTAFALDLYHALAQGEGNLFLSPYSISQALSMVYAGAQGETAAQMASALHLTLAPERVHAAANALDLALAQRAQETGYQEGTGVTLRLANALWGQAGYPFRAEFLETLAANYGAGLREVDYASDPEAARALVNEWVEEQTGGRIEDLLPQGSVSPDTRLVLANAIYMLASWMHPFNAERTEDAPFALADGQEVQVPMMRQTAGLRYAMGDGYVAVELPYIGGDVNMTVLMPEAGTLPAFEESLDSARLADIIEGLEWGQVRLGLPRFHVESGFDLVETLEALGMVDLFAFGPADLSGMDGSRDLYVSAVAHKAFVDVDEEGTEAAAATAVAVAAGAAPSEPPVITVDHPFLFVIRDGPTGAVLFVGRVMDPRA